ncbi:tetratricopeptide repeat protein [Thalassorhabdomicrobium marinisediminis]|uniref:Tetratricopeptide repeat protein n=1 Tax=Thalassorhabdomicrobium marinisediminis TaxID=2170577 RepID=A0A2T7FUF6_9RHOB|nr:tetratricopeptide repeat protein [Thalassorhabdomicrobium marinisediminis]PVA05795.1 tetratricopeptide repeat protein [Thalassorhabdomicrobium marinisediminis]
MRNRALMLAACAVLTACGPGGFAPSKGDRVFAPGVAGSSDIDGLLIGHRLMAAGEYELALRAYTRAAAQQGLNVDTLSALGSANLKLGRLNQAERLLRRATEEDPTFAAAWNNLGVILMERGKTAEAAQVFRRAFATDNGNSDEIRDNLRLALAKLDDPLHTDGQENEPFQLVRRGTGDYVILSTQ